MRLALVVNSIEITLTHVRKSIPESSLSRSKILRRTSTRAGRIGSATAGAFCMTFSIFSFLVVKVRLVRACLIWSEHKMIACRAVQPCCGRESAMATRVVEFLSTLLLTPPCFHGSAVIVMRPAGPPEGVCSVAHRL